MLKVFASSGRGGGGVGVERESATTRFREVRGGRRRGTAQSVGRATRTRTAQSVGRGRAVALAR